MMRLSDTLKLAYTKLRTRKLRLFIVLAISSLLFSALIAGSLIVTGALNSLDAFSKEGYSSRYIISGTFMDFGSASGSDPDLIARTEEIEKADKAAKKAAAKRLNIEYNESSEQQSVYKDESGNKFLNAITPAAQKALAEKAALDKNKIDLERFKQQTGGTATHYYQGLARSSMRNDLPTLYIMENGVEKIDNAQRFVGGFGMDSGSKGLSSMPSDWNLLDKELLKPFVLPGQNLDIGQDKSIPIVASYSAAQEVLKLPALLKNATSAEQKKRLEDVRSNIAGKTFEVCYRNYTSNQEQQAAREQQDSIRTNAGKKDYVKPELIYKPAAVPCAAPVLERDARSAEAKLYQKNQDEFDRQFGKVPAQSEVIKFRIIGVTPDSPYENMEDGGGAYGVMQILNSITTSSIGARWVSPLEAATLSEGAKDLFKLMPVQSFVPQQAFFAEYTDAATARKILNTKTCRLPYGAVDIASQTALQNDNLPICGKTSSPFTLNPFGSASLVIDDLKSGFRTIQMWAALIIGGIAAVVLTGIIGRIIADARKETAVFRATGASRLIIAQIYLVYTIYLVIILSILALAIGFAIALYVNSQFSAEASVNMALMFNVNDLSKEFVFYGIDVYDISVVVLSVLSAAMVGAVIPIAHNIQRNPIRDMREE